MTSDMEAHELRERIASLEHENADIRKERNIYAELSANKCVIQKVNDELGQQTLCTSAK